MFTLYRILKIKLYNSNIQNKRNTWFKHTCCKNVRNDRTMIMRYNLIACVYVGCLQKWLEYCSKGESRLKNMHHCLIFLIMRVTSHIITHHKNAITLSTLRIISIVGYSPTAGDSLERKLNVRYRRPHIRSRH